MKPPVLDGSPCRRSHSRVAVIAVLLLFLLCFYLMLPTSPSLAADDETTKAVRRASPEGMSIKGQKRIALVIGNNQYKESPLRNPTHDAEDIANVLRGLGFTVQTKINADQRGMEDAVKEFVREIQNGDVGLFYFSGHGVQVGGENYLIPVGDSIEFETDVRYKAVNAGLILGRMEESRNRTNIFILDACRNNPFKGFRSMSKGLTMMDAPVGTFIAYATAPGSVAADGTDRNSPYAKHFMQALKLKGMKIEEVFKQVLREVRNETQGKQIPWTASSLQDDFWFNPGNTSLPAPEPARITVSPGSEAPDYKEQIEREKRESEQEIAKLREARRVAALERERIEREKQELQRERERVAPLPAETPKVTRSPDYREEVIRLLSIKSRGGHPAHSAVKGLNNMYKDPEAVKWFRQAGEQGDPVAQVMLGRMFHWGHELGIGVPTDNAEAMKWYRKAADQGYAEGQCLMGFAYYSGDLGVAKNCGEAVKWYRKAADQRDAWAQYSMGLMLLWGLWCCQRLFRGEEVVSKGCRSGSLSR